MEDHAGGHIPAVGLAPGQKELTMFLEAAFASKSAPSGAFIYPLLLTKKSMTNGKKFVQLHQTH